MKKIYSLLLLSFSFVSFGQVFADDLNYPDGSLLTANGWTAHSGGGTNAIDVGASNGLTYTGYSGLTGFTAAVLGNAALLDNTGEDVNKTFAAPVTTGTLYYTFLVNVTVASEGYFTNLGSGTTFASRVYVKPSTTAGKINFGISNTGTASYAATPTEYDLNTTYLIIVKYDVSTTGTASMWVRSTGIPADEVAAGAPEHTTSGSGMASIAGVYLRQYNAAQNIIVDGLRVYGTWFNATPCPLALAAETKACDTNTLNTDTYTVTIPYTGGNSGVYNLAVNTGTIGGDNPNTVAAGNIIITGINEGTNLTLTVTGACTITKVVTSPECDPTNALPFVEPFNFTVGAGLGTSPLWTTLTGTGDEILFGTSNLSYPGLNSSGNHVTFGGAGLDAIAPLTPTTSGTLYYSYLLNVESMAGVTDVNGGYLSAFSNGAVTFSGSVWTKRIDDTTYNVGLEVRTANATNTTFASNVLQTGTTYYIVVGYTIGDSATASDDTASLWINPVVGAAQPAATITDTHLGTDMSQITGFLLRQDSTTETPNLRVDELRVGTTWTDVTGTLSVEENEIAGLTMYPNPANNILFIKTELNEVKNIEIYDIVGKQVLNTTTSSTEVNVSNLNSGLYIVKITEAGKTATKKLVIE